MTNIYIMIWEIAASMVQSLGIRIYGGNIGILIVYALCSEAGITPASHFIVEEKNG